MHMLRNNTQKQVNTFLYSAVPKTVPTLILLPYSMETKGGFYLYSLSFSYYNSSVRPFDLHKTEQ